MTAAVRAWTGDASPNPLALTGTPALAFYFLAWFTFSRGLFYFSLIARGKLTSAEWMVILRYEFVSAGLGAIAALAATAAFVYAHEGFVWLLILVPLGVVGVLARALIVEAIASEELRKVVAMEAVIAAGMPLEESLARIEELAARLVEWTRLHIYTGSAGSLASIYPPGGRGTCWRGRAARCRGGGGRAGGGDGRAARRPGGRRRQRGALAGAAAAALRADDAGGAGDRPPPPGRLRAERGAADRALRAAGGAG